MKYHFQEINEGALRQYIDALSVFSALEQAKRNAADIREQMKSLGRRSRQNETMYLELSERKRGIQKRLSSLRAELDLQRKLNKVYRVGRAPDPLVKLLTTRANNQSLTICSVVGTCSLYVYEAAAGIRFNDDIFNETDEVCLSCDTEKWVVEESNGTIHLHDQNDSHFVAQAKRTGILPESETFSEMIVSKTGRMARLNTVSPYIFAAWKLWMAEQPGRDPQNAKHDRLQAKLVKEMAIKYLPQLCEQ